MTLWNISTVMAPNLFLPRGRPHKLPKGEKQLAEGAAEVMCMMVQYQDLLWTVSDGHDRKLRGRLSTVSTHLVSPGVSTYSLLSVMGTVFHAAN